MGSLSLDRLHFDPSDPVAEGPTIGTYLLAGSDGDKLTSTLLGAKESLDINIAGSDIDLQVDLDLDDLIDDDAPIGVAEDPLWVGSRAANQASALGAVSAAGDKAGQTSDLYRRIFGNNSPAVGWRAEAKSVSVAAVQLDSTKQAGRLSAIVQNLGDKSIAIGPDNTVTFATGLVIGKGSNLMVEIGQALDIYAIGDTGASAEDIRVAQFG